MYAYRLFSDFLYWREKRMVFDRTQLWMMIFAATLLMGLYGRCLNPMLPENSVHILPRFFFLICAVLAFQSATSVNSIGIHFSFNPLVYYFRLRKVWKYCDYFPGDSFNNSEPFRFSRNHQPTSGFSLVPIIVRDKFKSAIIREDRATNTVFDP